MRVAAGETDEGAGGDALAGAGLADDGDALAGRQLERDALDDVAPHAVDEEADVEVLHRQPGGRPVQAEFDRVGTTSGCGFRRCSFLPLLEVRLQVASDGGRGERDGDDDETGMTSSHGAWMM